MLMNNKILIKSNLKSMMLKWEWSRILPQQMDPGEMDAQNH